MATRYPATTKPPQTARHTKHRSPNPDVSTMNRFLFPSNFTMVLDTSATTSPANHTDTPTPPAIECIPRFFVGVEGRQFRVDHKPQEIPLDDPRSVYKFFPTSKPFLATAAVNEKMPHAVVMACIQQLIWFAKKHDGIDYLQSFKVKGFREPLWFIEDGDGGAITALFPSDY